MAGLFQDFADLGCESRVYAGSTDEEGLIFCRQEGFRRLEV
jgi:hypothetical protein